MKVAILKTDIKKGMSGDPYGCPVVLALIRTKKFDNVWVGLDHISVRRPFSKWEDYILPVRAVKFINKFDMGLPVKPLTFSLDINP